MQSLKEVIIDVIDRYLHQNYGYLDGTKETGYTFDGSIAPDELAASLVAALKSRTEAVVAITDPAQFTDYPLGTTFRDKHNDVWMLDTYLTRASVVLVSPETSPVTGEKLIYKFGPITLLHTPRRGHIVLEETA